jgi:poly(hydroxyalkanoate) granule-associated protein
MTLSFLTRFHLAEKSRMNRLELWAANSKSLCSHAHREKAANAAKKARMVMPKKLKDLAHEAPENQLSARVRESANQIWLAGLGAFSKAQQEGAKVFDALVAEGERVQERTRTAADERLAEVRAKATGTWDKLEQVFEERVARALHSLNVPSRKDIDVLSRRVAELTAIAKKLSGEMEEGAEHAPRGRAHKA